MVIKFELEGFDEFEKKLDDLARHPEQFLEGHTFQKQQEVECESCGEKFEITIPVRIQKIVGKRGYGPGYSVKQGCPECGELNEYSCSRVVADIEFE